MDSKVNNGTAYKVNTITFIALYQLLSNMDLTKNHDLRWARTIQRTRKIGWLYTDNVGQITGWDLDSVVHKDHSYGRPIVDTTKLPGLTIIIAGKEIPISDESYESLKQTFLEK